MVDLVEGEEEEFDAIVVGVEMVGVGVEVLSQTSRGMEALIMILRVGMPAMVPTRVTSFMSRESPGF